MRMGRRRGLLGYPWRLPADLSSAVSLEEYPQPAKGEPDASRKCRFFPIRRLDV